MGGKTERAQHCDYGQWPVHESRHGKIVVKKSRTTNVFCPMQIQYICIIGSSALTPFCLLICIHSVIAWRLRKHSCLPLRQLHYTSSRRCSNHSNAKLSNMLYSKSQNWTAPAHTLILCKTFEITLPWLHGHERGRDRWLQGGVEQASGRSHPWIGNSQFCCRNHKKKWMVTKKT